MDRAKPAVFRGENEGSSAPETPSSWASEVGWNEATPSSVATIDAFEARQCHDGCTLMFVKLNAVVELILLESDCRQCHAQVCQAARSILLPMA